MTDFCHIAPTKHLPIFTAGRKFHLLLAHLIEADPEYAKFYFELKKKDPSITYIMDNSAFEMYKQGRPMYDSNKLADMAFKVLADYVVMSDYPGQSSRKTIEAAEKMGPELQALGFKTFFVPQSEVGDLDDLIYAYEWAADHDYVDYVGVSILGVPNGYGVEKDNKLQRFLSRWKFMGELKKHGILDKMRANGQKLHFLGMVDGPNEISLVRDYLKYIDTWDSSAGVWAGLNGIEFDNSPSGLIDGKFELEVDFSYDVMDSAKLGMALRNCSYIDNLIEDEYMKGWGYE